MVSCGCEFSKTRWVPRPGVEAPEGFDPEQPISRMVEVVVSTTNTPNYIHPQNMPALSPGQNWRVDLAPNGYYAYRVVQQKVEIDTTWDQTRRTAFREIPARIHSHIKDGRKSAVVFFETDQERQLFEAARISMLAAKLSGIGGVSG